MAMNHRRIGIRNSTDAALFLVSDWVTLSGMNNCLMYGVGCWNANSAGGANASPYNGNIPYNDTDILSNTVVSNGTPSSFQANGNIDFSTSLPPSRGYVYVTYGNVEGASAQRVFQSETAVGTSNPPQNIQTWKSYIGHNSMWIGDTPSKRLFFNVTSGGSVFAQPLDLTSSGDIEVTSNPTNPLVVGSNFLTPYTETSGGVTPG